MTTGLRTLPRAFSPSRYTTKDTAEVKLAYKHLGLKDIARINILPSPCSIKPSDAAQLLARSAKSSASDILLMCNDDSHEEFRPSDWISGWEYTLEKSFTRTITPDKPTTAPLATLIDG